MSKIIDLIHNNSSIKKLSDEVIKILSDFEINQTTSNQRTNGYLYYNSDFYTELIMAIGLFYLKYNYSSEESYQLSDYKMGDNVYYKNKNYIFKGLKGEDVNLFHKKEKYNFFIPIDTFLKNSIKIITPKRNQNSSVDKLISSVFKIDNPNYKVNYQVLVLTERKNVDSLEKVEIKLDEKCFKYSLICPSKYITATGNEEYLSHTNMRREPILTFTSDIIQAIEYAENYLNPTHLKIFVLGGKWHKYKQSQNLHDLIEVCKELNIPLSIYSGIFSVFSSAAINNLRKLDDVTSWLKPMKNLSNPSIEFKFISTNENLNDNVLELLEVINDIQKKPKTDYYYIFLGKLLSNFLNLSLSQVKGSTNTLANYKNDTLKSVNKIDKKLGEKLSTFFDNIYKNRYGFNVKREIENVTDDNIKTIIVVPNELVEETTKIFINKKNIDVRSYNEQIKSRMYYTFGAIILINPKPFERRRWITSNLVSKVYVFYPEVFLEMYSKSLKRDKIYIEELLKMNKIKSREIDIPYLNALNDTLHEIKLKTENKVIVSNDVNEMFNEETEKIHDENERILQRYYESYLTKLERNEFSQENDNQRVTVSYEVLLQNGYIFGTQNAKVNIVNIDNYIEEKHLSDIEPGDIIIEFDTPYSDEQYRNKFKKLYYNDIHSEELLNLDDDIFFDYSWKYDLLRYLERERMKPVRFKREIERKGFEEKSIGFYMTWSDIKKLPIAPRDSKFILKIGEMINSQKLIDNYSHYFRASQNVKKMFSGDRESYLSSLIGQKLEYLTDERFKKDTVISIDNIEIPNVSRSVTNKIWKEDSYVQA